MGDIFTPRERAKWQGVTGAVSALASILGPALGGFLTDNLTWGWVFYVKLPIGVAPMLVLIAAVVSLVLVFFLKEILLRGLGKKQEPAEAGEGEAEVEVGALPAL